MTAIDPEFDGAVAWTALPSELLLPGWQPSFGDCAVLNATIVPSTIAATTAAAADGCALQVCPPLPLSLLDARRGVQQHMTRFLSLPPLADGMASEMATAASKLAGTRLVAPSPALTAALVEWAADNGLPPLDTASSTRPWLVLHAAAVRALQLSQESTL